MPVADDQALVRTGFRIILREAGIAVAAEAADGREAVAAALRHRPDVILMDIRMPGMDGLEATRRILKSQPESGCRIIMLTTFDLDLYVYEALAAGASGFLLKHVSPEYLVAAVRQVRSGDALLAPSITRRLVERFAPDVSVQPAVHSDLTSLTPRELEVLRLLARGLSNAELAAKLTLARPRSRRTWPTSWGSCSSGTAFRQSCLRTRRAWSARATTDLSGAARASPLISGLRAPGTGNSGLGAHMHASNVLGAPGRGLFRPRGTHTHSVLALGHP